MPGLDWNGPRIVTRTIRPPRVAYVVESLEHCKSFIDIASLTWGGKYFFPIPYNKKHGISEEWWRTYDYYDPDWVFSYSPLDKAVNDRLLRRIRNPRERENRRVPTIDTTPNADSIIGQSIYTALGHLYSNEKKERRSKLFIATSPDGHPLELYIGARYGRMNTDVVPSILAKSRLISTLELNDLVPTELADISDNFFSVINQQFAERHSDRWPHFSLIESTLYGTAHSTPNTWIIDRSSNRRLYDEQYLLVISDNLSVEDFCWFWNLRSQKHSINQRGMYPSVLPLWLPLSIVEQNIEAISPMFHPNMQGFVLSKTLSMKRLQRIAKKLGEKVVGVRDEQDRFYSPNYWFGVGDYQEIYFESNKAKCPVPQLDVVKYCTGQLYFMMDIDLPKYQLPRLGTNLWGDNLFVNYRVSRTGLSFHTSQREANVHIDVLLPNEWQIIKTIARTGGYEVEVSDKGKLAKILIDLIGEVRNLWVFSGRSIYQLLDQLSELSQAKEFKSRLKEVFKAYSDGDADAQTREFQKSIALDRHDRVHQSFGDMMRVLGFNSDVSRKLIKWLVHRKMLFRGVELTCPLCSTKQWVSIDNINSTMRCVGCQSSVDIPLDVSNTPWRYRVNTLYAKAHEQGVIPHLLTLSHYLNGFILHDNNISEYYPGILFKPTNGGKPIDIDVCWIEYGELVICECKTNGRELSVKQVGDYIELAQSLECRRVVFSVLDEVGMDPALFEIAEKSPVTVQILTGEHLYDQFIGKFELIRTENNRENSPEKFESHLKSFLNRANIY